MGGQRPFPTFQVRMSSILFKETCRAISIDKAKDMAIRLERLNMIIKAII
jgi:hypothetical protein